MIKKKGIFYWPVDMTEPCVRKRNSKEINKNIRLVAPEEIGEAALIVLKKEYSMPKGDLIDQTAKLMGFTRVTEDIDKYIWKCINNYKKYNKILEINEKFTFNTDEELSTREETGEVVSDKKTGTRHRSAPKEIKISSREYEKPKLKNIEKIIKQTIKNHGSITIEYVSHSSGFTVRKIEPHNYDGIYIRAFCHLVKEDRTFRIDRIKNIMAS